MNYNGFTTFEGMILGHKFILNSLPQQIVGKVLDLGCGTGQLLKTIQNRYPNAIVNGVDIKLGAVVENINGEYWESDIFSWKWKDYYALVLIANQRLLEVDRDKALKLMDNIARHSKQLLIYNYAGWLHDLENFLDLFRLVSTNKNIDFEANLYETTILS